MTPAEYRAHLWKVMQTRGVEFVLTLDYPEDYRLAPTLWKAREYAKKHATTAIENERRFLVECEALIATGGAKWVVTEDEFDAAKPIGAKRFDLDAHLRKRASQNATRAALAELDNAAPIPAPSVPTEMVDGQTTVYDALAAAEVDRDEAMQRVDDAADPDWKQHADERILVTGIALREGFTGDDVWTVGGLRSTTENRALGPRINTAARRGLIEKTGEFRASSRSHAAPMQVWRLTDAGLEAALRQTAA